MRRQLIDAAPFYRAAIAIAPNYIEAYNNLGYALGQLGRVEDATKILRGALAIDPRHLDLDALINLGNLLRKHGMPEEALPNLSAAARSRHPHRR